MPEPLIPNDISDERLKWGYWFVTHKILLRRILIVVLIVVNAGLFGFSGYGFIMDILNAKARQELIKNLTTDYLNPAITASQSPRPLSSANVQILVSAGKYDFVTTLKNPNPNHYAHFSYRFVMGELATAPRRGFILPGEEKFVIELAFAAANRPSSAVLEISNLSWDRVDRHVITDWKVFAKEHLDIPITDVSYTPEIEIAIGKPTIGRTSFKIANNTGYGYYDVRCLVFMYRGTALAAVNSTVLPLLAPGDAKVAEVTWYENFGAISQIKVFSEIDITNNASYLRAQ